jgi:hypothetical protein
MWRTRRWWRKVDERCRVAPKSRTEHAEKPAPPPPRPLQPNALLDPKMALMCTVRRARRRRRPRAKGPRLLASIATPSAPAQTAHQSALIPRLNHRLLALCVAVRTHGWYVVALGQAAMRWMKTRGLLPRKWHLLCVQRRREPMSTHFRVAHGAATIPRRVTVDGRQADSVGIPRGRNGEGRRAPYMSLPQPHAAWGQKHSCHAEVMISGFRVTKMTSTPTRGCGESRMGAITRWRASAACLSEIPGPYL